MPFHFLTPNLLSSSSHPVPPYHDPTTTMNLLSSDLRQRPPWAEVATQLLHQQGGQWQETELDHNDITLMVPSGNSYRVLRLLLYSAVDVGKPRTMQTIHGLYDLCRLDRSGASEAKIVYALETDERSERPGGDGMGEGEGEKKGLEGFMKLQIDLLHSTQHQHTVSLSSLSSIPILPIPHPSDLPSLLSLLSSSSLPQPQPHQQPQSPPPPSARAPSSSSSTYYPRRSPTHPAAPHHHTGIYIPSRDTLLPLCTVPSTSSHNDRSHNHNNQRFFSPLQLSPHSVEILSGPIFINFPGLRDLLELVETEEGKGQIRNAMARAYYSGGGEVLGEVEAERFLAFWEHEFAV